MSRRRSHLLRLVFIMVLALAAVAPETPADEWSSFRGSAGGGWVVGGLPEGDGFLDFDLAWKLPLGSGYSGISIAGERLVTAAQDGESDWVVALDVVTGEMLWRTELGPAYSGHDGSHDGPIATPAIADGRIFMLAPAGRFVALDLATGALLWETHLVDELEREAPFYGYGGSPVVVGESVVVQVGGDTGAVVAFEVGSGAIRWRAGDGLGDLGSPSPILAELGGRAQVLAAGTDKLVALDPAEGALVWEVLLEGGAGPMGVYTQSPLPIDGDRVFVKHHDGETFVVELSAAGEGWRAEVTHKGRGLARSYSPPSAGEGALYGYTARFLSALDPASGELRWKSREPGDGFLVHVGGQLVVLTKTGSLHLGPASVDGWQETAKLELFDELAWTPPSFAAGALYVRSLGQIARVDLVRRDRQRVAEVETPVPAQLAPLLEAVAGGAEPAAAVEGFLAGKELPLIAGESVLFLWRGAAEDVAIAGEMIGMRREEPMHRLAGTDLWWWATELDRRARMSYLFFVDDEPALDPSHPHQVESTVIGPDMNWNRGDELLMSWFAMPDWPGLEVETRAAVDRSRVETQHIELQPATPEDGERPDAVVVPVHVWLPDGYASSAERYAVVFVHEAKALEHGAWLEALDAVVGSTTAPLIAVFVEAPRMRGFGDLFADQLVPEIDRRFRTIADRRARANVGMGWPGFSAAMMTFNHAETFGRLGVQSLFMLEGEQSALAGALEAFDATATPVRMYLEWGRWDLISPHEEMDFRRSSRLGWEMVTAEGVETVGGEVWDSTDFGSWRNRTGVMLESLFPLAGTSSPDSLSRWQTSP